MGGGGHAGPGPGRKAALDPPMGDARSPRPHGQEGTDKYNTEPPASPQANHLQMRRAEASPDQD